MDTDFDVIIVGGSYAGLSAAMALGRALKHVLIIDAGKPCNKQTPYAHNLITHDGDKPEEVAMIALEQVSKYTSVSFKTATVVNAVKRDNSFKVETDKGHVYTSHKILFATGIVDVMPTVTGFAECWGISVLHCPYCHGYEIRNQPTSILANGETAFEFAKIINNWTKDLTLLTNGPSQLTDRQRAELYGHNIITNEKPLKELIHRDGYLRAVVFNDNTSLSINALYAKLPFEQHCILPKTLGCNFTEAGFIKIDEFQSTSINGIFAAGDNTTLFRSLSNAIAAGNKAGAMINHQLINEDF